MSDPSITLSHPDPTPDDKSRPLAGERVAFTGVLASMTHRQAQTLVEEAGGQAGEHVTRQTTLLVVGEEGWPLEADGHTAVKFQQAQKQQQEGLPLRIVRESEWLRFLGLREAQAGVQRRYTPAMLSQMLNVPVTMIRGWERSGLIRPVQRLYRLPYFDYQEVAGARRLSELLEAGVSRREIETSLRRLESVLGSVERPLAQLEILASTAGLGYRDPAGRLTTTTGQRLLDFESHENEEGVAEDANVASIAFPQPAPRQATVEEDAVEARRLTELGDMEAAAAAYRRALRLNPAHPELNFHLAETLYRMHNPHGALERYAITVELAPDYVEAWTQMGCVAGELEDWHAAADAFETALSIHPDYPDAHFHLADALQQLGRMEDAKTHWAAYLEFDQRGPWADAARERLQH